MILVCRVLAVLPVLGAAVGAGSGGAGVEVAGGGALAAWAAICFLVGFFWAVVDGPASETFGADVFPFLLPAVVVLGGVEAADEGLACAGVSGVASSAGLLPPSWRLRLLSWFYQLDHSDPNLTRGPLNTLLRPLTTE